MARFEPPLFRVARENPIDEGLREPLYAFIGGIVRSADGALLAIGGIPDHVHLVLWLPTHCAVATMVKQIKGRSTKWVNELGRDTWFQWQRGYSAFTVSRSQLPTLRAYVRNQERHHQTLTFDDEMAPQRGERT